MPSVPHPRFLFFLLVLCLATAALMLQLPAERALVLGFDAASTAFLLTCLPLWHDTRIARIRSRAARDDGGRALLLLVSGVTLIAVMTALLRMIRWVGALTTADLITVIGTLVLAWIFVNTVYAFHYAHLYYDQSDGADVGGLDFPGTTEPVFSDFCYFSFTIGMTCQVSDVVVRTSALRRLVALHGLLSFLFNLGVLAMVVNVLAGVI